MLKKILLVTTAVAAASLIQTGAANAEAGQRLMGMIVSETGKPMEGVVVTAKKAGSTIAVSVVSDKDGWYSFPSTQLDPGHYAMKIRAAGYDMGDEGKEVDVDPDRLTTTVSYKLVPTKNLMAQLTNAELLANMPGTDAQKRFLLSCNSCHSYQRILNSAHTADEFMQVFERMAGYYPGSTPLQPQRLNGSARRNLGGGGGNAMGGGDARANAMRGFAEYLASVNLSKGERSYQFKTTLPRPTGKATKMIVTEYDLPRKTIMPHDVITDSDGMVWYSDFGALFFGKMDPKTGQVTEYPIPKIKENFPVGTLDLEEDKDGNMWVAMMYQGGIAKLDKKTGQVQTWSVPKEWQTDATQQSFASPNFHHVDGKVWVKNSDRAQILRLDVKSGEWENFGSFTDPSNGRPVGSYGINADRNNNLYMLDFNSNNIGILDGKTKKFEVFKTALPGSRPRRGRVDEQNRLWFAQYDGNGIGVFDPATKAIKEWMIPTPWSNPYDVIVDKNGDAWTGSMMSDRVVRISTKTGEQTEYLLPNSTNIRRVWVDNSTTPVTFWVGSNHGASIVKLQPIE
jgi:virginiamycin B lyase